MAIWKSLSTSHTLSLGAMYMPCGLAENVPSPHEDMKLPSVSHIVSGCAPLLKMYTSSLEFTAPSDAAPKAQYLGIFGHSVTRSYR